MIKAAIYIRVSTLEQTEGYSLDAQKDKLISFCKARDYNIYKIYTDPGFSGSTVNRPALTQLIKEIDKFDAVIVYKLDRLSRSQKDTLYLIEDIFLPNEVNFISATEPFDTSTPLGRAMIGILSIFAQLERENIKERMTMGKVQRAKEGKFRGGGRPPIGYDYKDGELILNEYEAMQVRKVVELYLQGYGSTKILEIMKSYGFKHKYGYWSGSASIYNALFNVVYIGKMNYRGQVYEGNHIPIYSEEKALAIKRVHAQRIKQFPESKGFRANSLLTGLLKCENCGAGMMIQNVHGKRKYYCSSRSKSKKSLIRDPLCKMRTFHEADLNEIIIKEFFKYALDESYLEVKKNDPPIPTCNTLIRKKIEENEERISKLVQLYSLDKIPMETISDQIDELVKEKEKLIESLEDEDIKTESPVITEEDIELLKDIENIWVYATQEEKRTILHSLINTVTVSDNDIKIEWTF